MKTAAGTVRGLSPARKSTGLVQSRGRTRGRHSGPACPLPPRVPHTGEVESFPFQMGKPRPLHVFIPQISVECLLRIQTWALWQVTQEHAPLPPTHRRRRSKPKHCSPLPLWKLQETAASTLIGLSGLADLQRAGESQHPYATAAALAWEWPQGRGQTAGTAIPGIAPLSSEQASETLCFSAPACLHAQRAPSCLVHPWALP